MPRRSTPRSSTRSLLYAALFPLSLLSAATATSGCAKPAGDEVTTPSEKSTPQDMRPSWPDRDDSDALDLYPMMIAACYQVDASSEERRNEGVRDCNDFILHLGIAERRRKIGMCPDTFVTKSDEGLWVSIQNYTIRDGSVGDRRSAAEVIEACAGLSSPSILVREEAVLRCHAYMLRLVEEAGATVTCRPAPQ